MVKKRINKINSSDFFSKNQAPLISIIVPVLNLADAMSECLSSLCAQTYENIEIILVYLKNDDESLKKIKELADARIKLVKQTQKNGPGGARNIGLDKAVGEWIGFAEVDDNVDADFYEKLLNSALKEKSDIVQAIMDINGKPCKERYSSGNYVNLIDKFSLIQDGASFDKLFNADFIRKNGIQFQENVRYEDNPFVFKAFYFANKITQINDACYHYRPDILGRTQEYQDRLKKNVIPVATEILEFARSKSLTSRELKLIQKKIIQSFVRSYVVDKEIYSHLLTMMGYPLFLRVLHYKKRLKLLKRKYFYFNKRSKK